MLTLLYRSDAVALLPFSALADICMRSSYNNRHLGVTGFLIEHEGTFLQVLEGEADAVGILFARISSDRRHQNLAMLGRWEQPERSFGFWAMMVTSTLPTTYPFAQMSPITWSSSLPESAPLYCGSVSGK